MSDLAYEVLRLLDAAERDPGVIRDRNMTDRIRRMARRSFDGAFVALQAPMAPESWEALAVLPSAKEETPTTLLEFPEPVEVVGFYMAVRPAATPLAGQFFPTTDDVQVSVQIDRKVSIATLNDARTSSAGTTPFVTSGAMSILAPRMIGICIDTPKPALGFKFRWKAGPNIWPDSICTATVFARYLRQSER